MKKILFLIIPLIGINISCEKRGGEAQKADESIKAEDEILYFKPDDPIAASTVKSYDSFDGGGFCTVSIPSPADSSTRIYLDINNDQIDDFIIGLSHGAYENTDYCGHCPIYEYDINIRGIDDQNKVVISDDDEYRVRYLESSEVISDDCTWKKGISLALRGACMRPSYPVEDSFLGVCIGENYGWIKVKRGSGNGIQVEAYAINLTAGNEIKAGQSE